MAFEDLFDPGGLTGTPQITPNPGGTDMWQMFGQKLFGYSGDITDLMGDIGGIVSDQNTLEMLANTFGLQSRQAALGAQYSETAQISPLLQRDVLDIQEAIGKIETYEKWQGRYSATRAGYAKAGILLDVGTPMAVTGKLLEAQDQELRLVKLNRSIQEWNQVNMPIYRSEASKINSLYARDMAEIDRELTTKAAKINKTASLLNVGAKVLNFAGMALG